MAEQSSHLLFFVVVSCLGELFSLRIGPGERDLARLPVFRHGDRTCHHHLAIFRGCRFVGAIVYWRLGQRVKGCATFNFIRVAIEFPHPRPVDWLTILIHPIRREGPASTSPWMSRNSPLRIYASSFPRLTILDPRFTI